MLPVKGRLLVRFVVFVFYFDLFLGFTRLLPWGFGKVASSVVPRCL